ncbi:hypothetical protein UY3_07403 [Chelonia mydas]|uniref:Uncharacterized protein n=1 Tax=Chelonia mydas TaxID=8469 RepID=M7BIG3_CHEMY|nr:hypothetical protein UY3_07403 [Chelonia mydas]
MRTARDLGLISISPWTPRASGSASPAHGACVLSPEGCSMKSHEGGSIGPFSSGAVPHKHPVLPMSLSVPTESTDILTEPRT